MLECRFCGKEFKYNCKLLRHLNAKKSCIFSKGIKIDFQNFYTKEEEDIYSFSNLKNGYYEENSLYNCIFCKVKMKNKSNIKAHIKENCKELRNRYIKEQTETTKDEKDKKIEELEEKLKNIEQKIEINSKQNIIINNIYAGKEFNINPLGLENTNFITKRMFKNIINTPVKAMALLTKLLNFNQNHLENWNIHKTDENSIIFYDIDKNWKIKNNTDFCSMLSTIRENQSFNLEEKFKSLGLINDINRYENKKYKIGKDIFNTKMIKELEEVVENGTYSNELFMKQNQDFFEKKFIQ